MSTSIHYTILHFMYMSHTDIKKLFSEAIQSFLEGGQVLIVPSAIVSEILEG